ncbi:MaoC/PaaZ C-terminal domain-containing protein [Actinomadura decatromicini]|uniref:Acyl dehydratase n=1 Tax=Actinomadura decatromicini TaxID=2604572 RepID=A0A5D3FS82_9ACTN|nr:MaoC/PaaZ C-terminal domain-containing protein [Actinomadura decatromicini]TYK50979.1 acyl dehydratase [Actinomadura decatromicini]
MRFFEDVSPGTKLEPLTVRPTPTQLFRFSAATWNAHRIHYDVRYAEHEGYPDVLVQSHLHGCFLLRAALDWAGPGARLRRFGWRNRGIAVPGDTLTCTGVVTGCRVDGSGAGIVECALEERNADGVLCAPGAAVLELPRRSPESDGEDGRR